MIFLLLAAAMPQTAADAERAFAGAARAEGQWTAFRRYAIEDSVMFARQPVKTQAFLKDPPAGLMWWAADSYMRKPVMADRIAAQ